MSQRLLAGLTFVCLLTALFFNGCGPEAKMGLNLNPGDSTTYKSGYTTKQFLKLDMAVQTKVRDTDISKTVEVTFDQAIESLNDDGSALAKITIKGIKIDTLNKDGRTFLFDSTKHADQEKPLYGLVGQSYKINITPDGSVTVADATDIRQVAVAIPGDIAEALVSKNEIIARHELHLPKQDVSAIKPGGGWSKVVWSHPKIMAKKTFEKVYVLDKVEGNIAKIKMTADQTNKPAEGDEPESPGFGPMAKMFDTQEKYDGEMEIDIKSGKVIKWNETCDAKYIVTDPTSKSKSGGPASMTMGLTHTIRFEKVD